MDIANGLLLGLQSALQPITSIGSIVPPRAWKPTPSHWPSR